MAGLPVLALLLVLSCLSAHGFEGSRKLAGSAVQPGGTLPAGCNIDFTRGPKRSDFPSNFIFGAATSSFQIEGSPTADGKGVSIWDVFSHTPGRIYMDQNADIACDSYVKYPEDLALLKDAGLNAYRFSISWTRIFPNGSGKVNQLGIDHYNKVIDTAIANGLAPMVTLFHWDTPQALQDKYLGWLNRRIINDYVAFADACFKNFGDRVKYWITANEPYEYATQGYEWDGHAAPGRCTDRSKCSAGNGAVEPYKVAHNILLSHSAAVFLYKQKYQATQKGVIGLTLDTFYYYPLTNSAVDVAAAARSLEFSFGWFAGPITKGDYPGVMKKYVGSRLPKFSAAEKALLANSADFIGLNYYTSQTATKGPKPSYNDSGALTDLQVDSGSKLNNGSFIGAGTVAPWLYIVPKGLYDLLIWIKGKYGKYPIYITENGTPQEADTLSAGVCDQTRVTAYQDHLTYLAQAIKDGVDVRGFVAWSALDNFEWSGGYRQRFGIHWVDFTSPNRTRAVKASAMWFKMLTKG